MNCLERKPLLELSNICFSYELEKKIINNLDFSLLEGEKIGIIGATGCGKSTLLYIMMGLLTVSKGEVSVFGKLMKGEKDFASVRTQIGFLFQNSDDQLFSPTVIDDIAFGPLNQGKTYEEAKNIAHELLNKLDIGELKHRITHRLSGGEKKLVALATALAMEPKLLLLDEPLTGLDPYVKEKIIKLIRELSLPMIIISHDWDFLEQIACSVYKIDSGKLFSFSVKS
jgi:cobalt/nickel transport system ATP-binding protein